MILNLNNHRNDWYDIGKEVDLSKVTKLICADTTSWNIDKVAFIINQCPNLDSLDLRIRTFDQDEARTLFAAINNSNISYINMANIPQNQTTTDLAIHTMKNAIDNNDKLCNVITPPNARFNEIKEIDKMRPINHKNGYSVIIRKYETWKDVQNLPHIASNLDARGIGSYDVNFLADTVKMNKNTLKSINIGETPLNEEEINKLFDALENSKVTSLDFSDIDLENTKIEAEQAIIIRIKQNKNITSALMPSNSDLEPIIQRILKGRTQPAHNKEGKTMERFVLKVKDYGDGGDVLKRLSDPTKVTDLDYTGNGDYNVGHMKILIPELKNLKSINLGESYFDTDEMRTIINALNEINLEEIILDKINVSQSTPTAMKNIAQWVKDNENITSGKFPERKVFEGLDELLAERKEKAHFGSKVNTAEYEHAIALTTPLSPLQCGIILQSIQKGDEKLSPELCTDLLSHTTNHGVTRRLITLIENNLRDNPQEFKDYRNVIAGIYQGRELISSNMDALIDCVVKHFPVEDYEKEDYDFCKALINDNKQTEKTLVLMNELLDKAKQNMPEELVKEIEEEQRKLEQERLKEAEARRLEEERKKEAELAAKAREFFQELNNKSFDMISEDDRLDTIKSSALLVSAYPTPENIGEYKTFVGELMVDEDYHRFLPKVIDVNNALMMTSDNDERVAMHKRILEGIAKSDKVPSTGLQAMSRDFCKDLLIIEENTKFEEVCGLLELTLDNKNADWILMQNTYEDLERIYQKDVDYMPRVFDIFEKSLQTKSKTNSREGLRASTDHIAALAAIVGDATTINPDLGKRAASIVNRIHNLATEDMANGSYVLSKVEDAYSKITLNCPELANEMDKYKEQMAVMKEVKKVMTRTGLDDKYLHTVIIPKYAKGDYLATKVFAKLVEDNAPYCSSSDEESLKWNIDVLKETESVPANKSIQKKLITDYIMKEAAAGNANIIKENSELFDSDIRKLLDDETDIAILKGLKGSNQLDEYVKDGERSNNIFVSGVFENDPEYMLGHIKRICDTIASSRSAKGLDESIANLFEAVKTFDSYPAISDSDLAIKTLYSLNTALSNLPSSYDKTETPKEFAQLNYKLLKNFNKIPNLVEARYRANSRQVLGILLYAAEGRDKDSESRLFSGKISAEFSQQMKENGRDISRLGLSEVCLPLLIKNKMNIGYYVGSVVNPYKVNMPMVDVINSIEGGYERNRLINARIKKTAAVLSDFPELFGDRIYTIAEQDFSKLPPEELGRFATKINIAAKVNLDMLKAESEYIKSIEPSSFGRRSVGNHIKTIDAYRITKDTVSALMIIYDICGKKGFEPHDVYKTLYDYRFGKPKNEDFCHLVDTDDKYNVKSNQETMEFIYDHENLENKKLKSLSENMLGLNKLMMKPKGY